MDLKHSKPNLLNFIPNAWCFINLFYVFRQLGLLEQKFDTIIMIIYLFFNLFFLIYFIILVLYSYYSNNISML